MADRACAVFKLAVAEGLVTSFLARDEKAEGRAIVALLLCNGKFPAAMTMKDKRLRLLTLANRDARRRLSLLQPAYARLQARVQATVRDFTEEAANLLEEVARADIPSRRTRHFRTRAAQAKATANRVRHHLGLPELTVEQFRALARPAP